MPTARLVVDGAWRLPSGLAAERLSTLPVDEALDGDAAGSRGLLSRPWCAALVDPIRRCLHAAGVLDGDAVAVQCTLFRKTADRNWKVPYHQDLSVPVAARVEHPELSGWSSKEGALYVQPPAALLEKLLAVRLHLDDCGQEDGALRVVPGSHRHGRIESRRIAGIEKSTREQVCLAAAGDLWLMRPLLLHASSKAARPSGRRVLHFLFAPPRPGCGLQWNITV